MVDNARIGEMSFWGTFGCIEGFPDKDCHCKQSGVECDTCLTVNELTDLMRTKDYDLLITDLKMPEANGYEVLELLRTSEIGNSQTIPIVAATAAGYVEEEELKRKGFAAVLYKPYSIDELFAITGNCIKPKGVNNIDLSPLLAFGDKRRTLEKLVTTTQSDMEEVRKAAEVKDIEALDNWVHHLRNSWMLIKAEQPLKVLYNAIHKEKISNKELSEPSVLYWHKANGLEFVLLFRPPKHRFPMPKLPQRRTKVRSVYKYEPYLRTQDTKAGFSSARNADNSVNSMTICANCSQKAS